MNKPTIHSFFAALVASFLAGPGVSVYAQEAPVPVEVMQVRELPLERMLSLSGRIYSRNDVSMSLTLPGELEWVMEAGSEVESGNVIGSLDQKPIALRKNELEHLAERERVNVKYLGRELVRLKRLRKDNNASERLVDESESHRDISDSVLSSIESRIQQLDDELRRSQLVAPFSGVIAQRYKRGGEYAQPGDVIVRLVDMRSLELRFQMPVAYLRRVATQDIIHFTSHSENNGSSSKAHLEKTSAQVRSIILAANPNSQTFEVLADFENSSASPVIAGQLVTVGVSLAEANASLQIPRDAIVLREKGSYVFLISKSNTAKKVDIEVGEGSGAWITVTGTLSAGDRIAIRGVERLQDGQQVLPADS
ncbi:MAG: RND family efflux transporter MFP subunit [Halioglobus sp.]|jgi:RND family efflux transporter MFP subunit